MGQALVFGEGREADQPGVFYQNYEYRLYYSYTTAGDGSVQKCRKRDTPGPSYRTKISRMIRFGSVKRYFMIDC